MTRKITRKRKASRTKTPPQKPKTARQLIQPSESQCDRLDTLLNWQKQSEKMNFRVGSLKAA